MLIHEISRVKLKKKSVNNLIDLIKFNLNSIESISRNKKNIILIKNN